MTAGPRLSRVAATVPVLLASCPWCQHSTASPWGAASSPHGARRGSMSTAYHRGDGGGALSLKISNLFTQVWVFRCCTLLQPHLGHWSKANLSQMGRRHTHQLKNTQATIRHCVLWFYDSSRLAWHLSTLADNKGILDVHSFFTSS